jgi:hypothetical protein
MAGRQNIRFEAKTGMTIKLNVRKKLKMRLERGHEKAERQDYGG